MNQTAEALFDEGIQRYKDGESPETLIPLFKDVCDRAPKNSAAWTCLAWLYLLADRENSALKAAQRAVKLNPQDPQARVNLAVAMLETGKSGVRQQVETVGQMIGAVQEIREEIQQSIADGLQRKPDWPSLTRIQSWLFE